MSQSSFTYTVGFRTDVGQQRSHNEDAAEVFDLPGAQAAFVVCDGMGGLRAGDVASREAVRVVQETLRERFSAGASESELTALLRDAFARANDAVNALNTETDAAIAAAAAAEDEDAPTQRRAGVRATGAAKGLMGTTCVTGILLGDVLYLAHAGDSRAYRLRGRTLSRLTDDHSYVGERVRAGDITEAEAKVSRFRNIVTRAIGIEATVDPEVRREPMAPGDTILVCSDGLNTMLEDAEIAQVLNAQARATPERAASALVDVANKKGGHDNITVLVLRCAGEGVAPIPPPDSPRSNGRERDVPGVVDMDAPPTRRRSGRRSSPVGTLLVGALLMLALLGAALALVPSVRHRAVALLGGGRAGNAVSPAPPSTGLASSPLVADYARLVYDAPQPLSGYLARGDVLAFSHGRGLYFVYGGSGAVICLDRNGKPRSDRSVAKLDLAPDDVKQAPAGRVFITSDPQGNVYLSYTQKRIVEKRSPDGLVLQTFKNFDHPEAIALDEDSGDLYVVDASLIKVLRAHSARAGAGAAPAPRSTAPTATSAGKPSAKRAKD